MRSIFDHKQYDAANLHGSGFTLTVRFEKEINGINWEVTTQGKYHGRKYHNRDLNLKLLNNEIDSENYIYEHTLNIGGIECSFIYDDGHLITKSWGAESVKEDNKKMSFDEACEHIKEKKKLWEDMMC